MISPARCAHALLAALYLSALAAGVPRYFGFWQADEDIESTLHQFVNLQFTANITLLQNGAALGVDGLYFVEDVFFTWNPNGSLSLRPDYVQQWAAAAAVGQELLTNGTIIGFFLGDELVWNCLPPADLITACNAIRATFPRGTATLWYNEATPVLDTNKVNICGKSVKEYKIPAALDWFSIDQYHMDGPVDNNWVQNWPRTFYETYIFPNLTSQQSAVLVPGSFGSNVNRNVNNSLYDVMCMQDAGNYLEWAVEDARISGIVPWNWGGCPECNGSQWTPPHTCCMDEIGTKFQPLTRSAWTSIGKFISGKP